MEEEVEQTEFDVVLTAIGPAKIAVIKEVRALTKLGLPGVQGNGRRLSQGHSRGGRRRHRRRRQEATWKAQGPAPRSVERPIDPKDILSGQRTRRVVALSARIAHPKSMTCTDPSGLVVRNTSTFPCDRRRAEGVLPQGPEPLMSPLAAIELLEQLVDEAWQFIIAR